MRCIRPRDRDSINGQGGTTTYLYAADFEHAKIDVYDGAFQRPRSMDPSAIGISRIVIPSSTFRTSAESVRNLRAAESTRA
jgi:hypothetical protein